MLKTSKFDILPCIVFSLILHSLVFFVLLYKNEKKDLFVQTPFDVSFYSPAASAPAPSTEIVKNEEAEIVKKEEPKPVEKKEIKKDDIVIKKKIEKKEEKKKEVKKEVKKEEPKPVEKKVETKVEEAPKDVAPAKEESTNTQTTGTGSGSEYNKGVMFTNKNFKYGYYTNTIVKKIRKNWQWSATSAQLRAVVFFEINKIGDVNNVKIVESSKNSDFDQNAIRAVQLSNPFAPLPAGYEDETLGVYFEFKFNN